MNALSRPRSSAVVRGDVERASVAERHAAGDDHAIVTAPPVPGGHVDAAVVHEQPCRRLLIERHTRERELRPVEDNGSCNPIQRGAIGVQLDNGIDTTGDRLERRCVDERRGSLGRDRRHLRCQAGGPACLWHEARAIAREADRGTDPQAPGLTRSASRPERPREDRRSPEHRARISRSARHQ